MNAIRVVCLWPGLPGAWHRGSNVGLAMSLVSAWGLCLLLLATWVWPEWFSVWLVRGAWLLAGFIWLGASIGNHFQIPHLTQMPNPKQSAAFEQAQREYLRGHWFDAEAKLLELLHGQPRDAEALLLLTGVLRKTHRWKSAMRRLRELELLDTALRWKFEIAQEKKLIDREISAHSGEQEQSQELADVSVESEPTAECP